MSTEDIVAAAVSLPLAGCRVVEHSRTVAAAYAGRLLAAMGATVVMLEPPEGSPLRAAPPMLRRRVRARCLPLWRSASAAWCATLSGADGQRVLERELGGADILIDDTPLQARARRAAWTPRPSPGVSRRWCM